MSGIGDELFLAFDVAGDGLYDFPRDEGDDNQKNNRAEYGEDDRVPGEHLKRTIIVCGIHENENIGSVFSELSVIGIDHLVVMDHSAVLTGCIAGFGKAAGFFLCERGNMVVFYGENVTLCIKNCGKIPDLIAALGGQLQIFCLCAVRTDFQSTEIFAKPVQNGVDVDGDTGFS